MDHLPINHVLINEYPPGTGFGMHNDGRSFAPHTATLSLGSLAAFEIFSEAGGERLATLVLPPRGLLVFSGAAYEACLHRVPATLCDVEPEEGAGWLRLDLPLGAPARPLPARKRRVSLTMRHVLHLRAPRAGEAASAEERAWVAERLARSAALKAEAAPGTCGRLVAAHSASHLAAELWPEPRPAIELTEHEPSGD